jgi:excisionase family DNA binding protein
VDVMRDRFYSTADLARVCGVSISTIKRWTDSGFLRCVRTPGGHRKYRVQDVAEAARRLGLTSADADTAPAARIDELALLLLQGNRDALAARLAAALRNGDAAGVRGSLLDLHRHGMPLAEALLLLPAALDRIEAGPAESAELDAFERRRAQAICSGIARQLAQPASPPPGAPLALVATRPGERADLAAGAVLLALAEAGWRLVDLGLLADLEALRGGLRAARPELVVLVDHEGDAILQRELRSEAESNGADLVVLRNVDRGALEALRFHHTARESGLEAASV